jgi:hypothetical protein
VKEKSPTERPCRAYARGVKCTSGLDHCFNCGRHLDADGRCAKRCGEGNEAQDDAANNDVEGK